MEKLPLMAVCHSMRTEGLRTWRHMQTYETMLKPLQPLPLWEDRVFDIGGSRQKLTETALGFSEVQYLLFIDDDIIIHDPWSLVKMHNFLEKNNQYIISGLYWNSQPQSSCGKCKQPVHRPIAMDMEVIDGEMKFQFMYPKEDPADNAVFQVGAVPAGFLLVKREVFEKIPKPWFVYGSSELSKSGKTHGEDMYFSWKARENGYKLFVDARTKLIQYVPGYVGRPVVVNRFLTEEADLNYQVIDVKKNLDRVKS